MTHPQAVRSVVITPDREASLRESLNEIRDRVRKRAFELYCERTGPGEARADWHQAEQEIQLSHLAEIEDNEREIRITAAIRDVDAAHLTVNILPERIVVQGEPVSPPSIKRQLVFDLCEPIVPAEVRAEFCNGDLTIIAPKLHNGRGPKGGKGQDCNRAKILAP
jgi:HSP20 family molecular chaperone IbpA